MYLMGHEKFVLGFLLFCVVFFNLYYATCFAADPLMAAVDASASAMKAHSERLKVVSQNIANEDSTGNTSGAQPYRRKIIIFENKKNKNGTDIVHVKKIDYDRKNDFNKKYDPSHPAADQDGYVLYPNVNKNIEFTDAKEAQRSFEANLNSIEISKSMMNKTLDIIKIMKLEQTTYLNAASAYNKMASDITKMPAAQESPVSFSNVMYQSMLNGASANNNVLGNWLTETIEKTRDKLRKSEYISSKALVKEASLTDMVTAISEAEITLQSIVNIRDKVIAAYQDIIKMQI